MSTLLRAFNHDMTLLRAFNRDMTLFRAFNRDMTLFLRPADELIQLGYFLPRCRPTPLCS